MGDAASEPTDWTVVAIDGTAASGKGTIARLLAERFALTHLDTGLLYRGTAHRVLADGGDPRDPDAAVAAARAVTAGDLRDPRLRSSAVGEASSIVAAHAAVRAALLERQRRFAAGEGAPPDRRGAVLDGRDITSVVCPEAQVRLFVDAALEKRAERRARERAERGETADFEQVRMDLAERDRRDRSRADAPLVHLADVPLLDTTELGIDAAVERAAALVVDAAPWLDAPAPGESSPDA